MDKILIIEDELDLLDTLKDLLILNGYKVFTSSTGEEALNLIKKEFPSLVISDINLPGEKDGFDVLREMQEDPELSIIPFLCISGNSKMENLRKGMLLGADDFLPKPFEPDTLLEIVKLRIRKNSTLKKSFDEIRNNIATALPHELFTPLNAIMGFSSLVKDKILKKKALSDDDIIRYMNYIFDSGRRLLHTSKNFTFFTRLMLFSNKGTSSNEIKDKYTFYPAGILSKLVRELADFYDREGDIVLKQSNIPTKIPITQEYFEKLIWEMLDNSFKFSKKGDKIIVNATEDEKLFLLKIKDFGSGFPKEKINSIQAFSRFNYDLHAKPGLGLGLCIVKLILDLCGGNLDIQISEDEPGSIFIITLPL